MPVEGGREKKGKKSESEFFLSFFFFSSKEKEKEKERKTNFFFTKFGAVTNLFSGSSSRNGKKCEKEMTTGRGDFSEPESFEFKLRVSEESCGSLSESKNPARASSPPPLRGSSPGGHRQALKSV